jgi:heme exporter protein C
MNSQIALRALSALAVAGLLGAGAMIFLYAPPDAVQGDVQRIFYLHVSAAICAYASFAVVLVGAAYYLWKESWAADRLARAAAEVGLVMTSVTLVMGSLWGAFIWGTYWQWGDARLDSTLVLWLLYAGYLMVHRLAPAGRRAARLASVVGIVGFLDVPIVHFSVTWWRTIHPGPVLTSSAGPQLPPSMLITFAVTAVALLLFSGVLITVRYRVEALREEASALRSALVSGDAREPALDALRAAPARPEGAS